MGWAGLGWLGWAGSAGLGGWAEPDFEFKGFLRLEPDLNFGKFCDWNLVLGWVGLEIDGLGGSTPAMTSNFYLFLS